jgi:hypothetical protein
VQAIIPTAELLDRPLDRRRPVLDLAEEPNLARAAALGNRHSMLHLGHVERTKASLCRPWLALRA